MSKFAHHHLAKRPHNHLRSRYAWYDKWHNWDYHHHVHYSVLGVYLVVIGAMVLVSYGKVLAASDLFDSFDFTDPGNYSIDAGLETSGTTARLKAQNYATDANTAGLFHFDESNGSIVDDASANSNDGTVTGATFGTGILNNALDFNGTNQFVSVPDSASLSFSQHNTIEAWTKFDNLFAPATSANRQGVVDKGDYQLYYDNETGKLTYELADSTATSWTQRGGNDISNSWDLDGKTIVRSQASNGSDRYIGLGLGTGDAEVWKYSGGIWTQIGGDGINSSWQDQQFEDVQALETIGTTLYAGLGTNLAGDGEVWSCNMSTSCTVWTKIGGDGINSGWAVSLAESVNALRAIGTDLYAGLGNSANDAEVWRWNGAVWSKIGGDSINSGWTANYDSVQTFTDDGTNLYVGLGNTATEAEVWSWNGAVWSKIGGDGLNSSWNTNYEQVTGLSYYGGSLYAGLALTANDAEVWQYTSGSWTQIGGDGLNSSWNTIYEGVYTLTNDGTNLYAGVGNGNGEGEAYMWNGAVWSKIGGDGLNGSWTTAQGDTVWTLMYAGSTLYAGVYDTGGNGQYYSWDGNTWTLEGGGYVNKSWGFYGQGSVETLFNAQGYMYAGLGGVAGSAQIWRYDGTNWEIIGGQGINNSWAPNTYELITSINSYGGDLVVGLGLTANEAEVWSWDGNTWTQIGGDSLNSGWTTNYEEVDALASYGGFLYAGLGTGSNDAEVWRWNGASWTKIGGDSTNSGWTTGYDRIGAMAIYDGELHIGMGSAGIDSEVWRWNGASWTKIGGDSLNSSWDNTIEQVQSMVTFHGKLYAGVGNTSDDAELWEWDGTTWAKVGGDDVNSSWTSGTYELVRSLTVYNGNLYAGIGNGTGDGELWRMASDASWTKVGGNSVNGGWANLAEEVEALSVYRGKLYAGTGNTSNVDSAVWSLGNNGYLQSTTASFDTNWHHVAATFDGSSMKIYIDGALDSSTSVTLSLPDSNKSVLIGSGYGGREQGKAQSFFEGQIDEVRLSNIARSSFTSLPYPSSSQVISLATAVRTSGVKSWDSFAADEADNGGTITYRLSDDNGTTWKYWDGSGWVASASTAQANAEAVVNTNIATFPVTFYGLKWQAILTGNGSQQVTLNSVNTSATSDLTVPSANASSLLAYKSFGGSSLSSNAWTNGSSPYFSWTAGTDDEAGIKGYCLYLGTDNTADPATTKGLLGNSPVYTANHCQFIVAGNSVDLATAGYISTALTTSTSPYYLSVKAIDNAGNVFGTAAQFQFRFDNTPPSNPGFITSPSGFINTKTAALTWPTVGGQATADTGAGVAGLQYRINSTVWYGDSHSGTGDMSDLLTDDGSYTTATTPDFDNINEGINTVYFRTWDLAGNVTSSYVTAALKINTAGAPSEPQNVQATPSTNTSNSFSFSWDTPGTFIGDVNNLTYCYSINTLPNVNTCNYTGGGITSLGAGPYATQPGVNTFYVVAKDESSNINYASYGTVDFTANTTAPGIATNADIVDVSIKSTSNWRLAITWDAPSDVGAGVASYKIYRSINNVSFSFIGSSTSTTYIDAGLSQQQYYYSVKACDSTNNCGADSTVVSMLPTGKFTSPALLTSDPAASNITTKKALITWATDRSSDSKIAIGTTSGLYASSEIGNSTQTNLHTLQLENLAAGTTYYYVAKWTDEDGNIGTSQEFTFTTSPAPVVKEIQTLSVGLTTANIQFSSKGASKINLYYGLSDGFGGLKSINTSQAESQYNFGLDGLSDGTKYFYRLSAFDAEGGEYLGNTFSFTTPPRPRIANLRFQPVEGEPTSTQMVSWTTNVASTSTVTYGKVGSSGTDLQLSTLTTDHQIKITNLEDDSEYFIIAQGRDEGGNLAVSDRQQFRTALDTRSPLVSEISVESSIRGTGAEARGQVVVSWKTDEPSMSQVAYAEGSKTTVFNNKSAEDNQLSTDHLVIISDLPTSKVYSLQPLSKDKSGNVGQGEIQSAIIGRANESVLTIILNTLQKVFGF